MNVRFEEYYECVTVDDINQMDWLIEIGKSRNIARAHNKIGIQWRNANFKLFAWTIRCMPPSAINTAVYWGDVNDNQRWRRQRQRQRRQQTLNGFRFVGSHRIRISVSPLFNESSNNKTHHTYKRKQNFSAFCHMNSERACVCVCTVQCVWLWCYCFWRFKCVSVCV